jgi:hypothetical protein
MVSVSETAPALSELSIDHTDSPIVKPAKTAENSQDAAAEVSRTTTTEPAAASDVSIGAEQIAKGMSDEEIDEDTLSEAKAAMALKGADPIAESKDTIHIDADGRLQYRAPTDRAE